MSASSGNWEHHLNPPAKGATRKCKVSGCSEVRADAHLEVWISCVRRGSYPSCLQNTDGYIRDTSESDWSHLCQLPDMATLRGSETLHWLLQHQQREMPALADTSQKCQGEQTVAAEPQEGPLLSLKPPGILVAVLYDLDLCYPPS